jgi:DNA-binding transcriptional regulator YdaS (Cro superfamily)
MTERRSRYNQQAQPAAGNRSRYVREGTAEQRLFRSLTPAQQRAVQEGRFQRGSRVGSVTNPHLIRDGVTPDSLPSGAYFIDRAGQLQSRRVSENSRRNRESIPQPLRAVRDAGDLAVQGITFGQMPRISGAAGALSAGVDAVRAGSVEPIAARYRAERQAQIDDLDAIRERAPIAAAVGEGIGGLGSGTAAAGLVGRAAARVAPGAVNAARNALAPRVGQAGGLARGAGRATAAAAGGAAGGAVYGSGEGRAAQGAVAGAVGGAVGEPVIRAGAGAIRGATNAAARIRGRAPVAVPQGARRPARVALSRMSPEAAARQEAAQRAGLDPLANVDLMTTRGQRLVRAAASASDEGQDIARNYGGSVRAAAPERASRIARMTTGEDVDLNATREALAQHVRDVGNAQYPQFEQVRVTVTPEMLQALSSPRGRAAVRQAADSAAEFGRGDDQAQLNYLARILSGAEDTDAGRTVGGLTESTSDLARQTPEFREAFSALSQTAEPAPVGQGRTLIDFIRAAGGIRDRDGRFGGGMSGNVVNALGRANRIPGLINNQTGIPLEDMAERARQAGFFGVARRNDANTYDVQSGVYATGDELMDLVNRSIDSPDMWRYGNDEAYQDAMRDYFDRQAAGEPYGGAVRSQAEAQRQAALFAEQEGFRSPSGDWTNDPGAIPPSIMEMPELRASALEDVYRSLRDTTADLASQPGSNSLSVALGQRTRAFDAELQARVPEIAQARSAYQTAAQERDALGAGLGAMSNGQMLPDLEASYQGLPNAAARLNFRRGAQAFLEQEARSNPGGTLARLSPQHLTGGDMTVARLNAMEAPGNAMAEAGMLERNRLATADLISPLSGSLTANNMQDLAAIQGVGLGAATTQGMITRLMDFATRAATRMSDAELAEFVRLGVSPADLNRLRELAQFAPDQLPGAVRAILGGLTADQIFRDRTGPAPTE